MKKQTREEEEFYSAIKIFIISLLSGAFCAYVGYVFCMDNEYNLVKGVVFGFLFPFIYGIIHHLIEWIRGKEPYWLVTMFFVFVLLFFFEYIPVWVGIIAIAIVIYLQILQIRIAYRETKKEKQPTQIDHNKKDNPQETEKMWKDEEENTENEEWEEEFYCERCFEKISEEEYEGNDGMCEDCYEDVLLEREKE